MQLDALRDAFLGSDPIAGQVALDELVAHGDAGEEAMFSSAIEVPSVQVRRRWLRYVATRPDTIGPRLLARVRDEGPSQDRLQAAGLFIGLPPGSPVLGHIGAELLKDFAQGMPNVADAEDHWRVTSAMAAIGADDKTPWQLWNAVSDSYAWEKLGIHAFRAACCVAARFGQDHLGLLERFVTRKGKDAFEERSSRGIDSAELWLQAYYTFSLWRSGSLVDGIFARWSTHEDPILRQFGAMILSAVGFRRAQEPLLRWIAAEQDTAVLSSLLVALAQCGTPTSADALLALAARGETNREALAVGARFATDRTSAIEHLERTADGEDSSSAEALVALARMGVTSHSLSGALFSPNQYCRLNAALAYGILNDRSRIDDLLAMQIESSGPFESVYVAAALAMLGQEHSSEALHQQLVRFSRRWVDGGEFFYLKPALKQAIVTAFERRGPDAAPFLKAWKTELEPLDVIARPVEGVSRAHSDKASASATASSAAPLASTAHRNVPERFRVAFSFAGTQRESVKAVAEALEHRLGRGLVFFDDWFQAYVAGTDADILLQRVYGQQSDLVVMCIAGAYDDRPWTMVEHRALRGLIWGARAGSQQAMRVLPLRFGDGDVEGVLINTIAPDVRGLSPADVADLILARLQLIGP